MAHHEIPATPENMVLGYLDAASPPVLEVESGDTVTLQKRAPFLGASRRCC